jgi:hypothetical protein
MLPPWHRSLLHRSNSRFVAQGFLNRALIVKARGV